MLAEITGWRSVGIHGQPPRGEPVLARNSDDAIWLDPDGYGYSYDMKWMPMSEVRNLPHAEPPVANFQTDLRDALRNVDLVGFGEEVDSDAVILQAAEAYLAILDHREG